MLSASSLLPLQLGCLLVYIISVAYSSIVGEQCDALFSWLHTGLMEEGAPTASLLLLPERNQTSVAALFSFLLVNYKFLKEREHTVSKAVIYMTCQRLQKEKMESTRPSLSHFVSV